MYRRYRNQNPKTAPYRVIRERQEGIVVLACYHIAPDTGELHQQRCFRCLSPETKYDQYVELPRAVVDRLPNVSTKAVKADTFHDLKHTGQTAEECIANSLPLNVVIPYKKTKAFVYNVTATPTAFNDYLTAYDVLPLIRDQKWSCVPKRLWPGDIVLFF